MLTNATALAGDLERCRGVVRRQTEGLSHADSLIQPPVRGNCLNWIIGHIVHNQDLILLALGQPPIWTYDEARRYKRESDPISDEAQALPLERLLRDLDASTERILTGLHAATPEMLAVSHQQKTVAEHIALLIWHETYHVGQLELLRQLAGKNDKVS